MKLQVVKSPVNLVLKDPSQPQLLFTCESLAIIFYLVHVERKKITETAKENYTYFQEFTIKQ